MNLWSGMLLLRRRRLFLLVAASSILMILSYFELLTSGERVPSSNNVINKKRLTTQHLTSRQDALPDQVKISHQNLPKSPEAKKNDDHNVIARDMAKCPIQYNFTNNVCNISIHYPSEASGQNTTFWLNFKTVVTLRSSSLKESTLVVLLVKRSCELVKWEVFSVKEDTRKNAGIADFFQFRQNMTLVVGVLVGPVSSLRVLDKIGLNEKRLPQATSDFVTAFVGRVDFRGHLKMNYNEHRSKEVWLQTSWHFGEMFPYNLNSVTHESIVSKHPDIEMGGFWRPPDCLPSQTVAIVLPYRNREENLMTFLENMLVFLKLQKIAFNIFVVEQTGPQMFNRAALLNIGYVESRKVRGFDCYIFHDVDVVPEDLTNYYLCGNDPRHVMVSRSVENYKQARDPTFFGGAMALRPSHIDAINGFPNIFFGWGGEDSEIRSRLLAYDMPIVRYPAEVSHYAAKKHPHDSQSPQVGFNNTVTTYRHTKKNKKLQRARVEQFVKLDGLTTLNYTLVRRQSERLYTKLKVEIPGSTSEEQQLALVKKYRDKVAELSNT